MPINFKHYDKKQKLVIPFLIQFTLDNWNQNRFPLDFFHTFTVILPSVTRSNFCFPSDQLYIILPSITPTMFKGVTTQKKKQCTEVQNIEKTNQEKKSKKRILRVNSSFLLFCHSVRFKCSVHLSILIKLWYLIPFLKY